MSKTIHVQRRENATYEVHVESPSSSGERKVAGRFLDATRLQEELQHHGCTPEQIEKGMGELTESGKQSARIAIEE